MAKAYHIVQWDSLYETNETRKIRALTYYAKPNKLIGLGIGRTLQHPKALEFLGVWALIEALASIGPSVQRGWLIRNGQPLTTTDISYLLRVPESPIQMAIDHFASEEIGWLELTEFPLNPTNSREIAGRTPGDSPGNSRPPTNSREIAGTISTRGKREGEEVQERDRERGAPADSPEIPTEAEVRDWAALAGVDPEYAVAKCQDTTEKHAWVANGRLIDWRKRWKRFWDADCESFLAKKRRAATAPGKGGALRPDGWKEGDQEWWWTDSLERLESALAGAAHGDQKKTAARLKEILERRKQK